MLFQNIHILHIKKDKGLKGLNLEPYDNLKKYIIKANPNNCIFEETITLTKHQNQK